MSSVDDMRVHAHEVRLSLAQFQELASLLQEFTGIFLGPQKHALMESRLQSRLRALALPSFAAYVNLVRGPHGRDEMQFFINALTTNKTDFFREQEHFDLLEDTLRKRRDPRCAYLWSAASSTGEEPYSLAILCEKVRAQQPSFDYRVLATDIDTNVLARAQEGVYPANTVAALDRGIVSLGFEKCRPDRRKREQSDEPHFRVRPEIQEKMKFRAHNLLYELQGCDALFDIIFLRNVLIYFSKETTQQVIANMWRALRPGGLLFVGHAETLNGVTHHFRAMGSSVYGKDL